MNAKRIQWVRIVGTQDYRSTCAGYVARYKSHKDGLPLYWTFKAGERDERMKNAVCIGGLPAVLS